jgi:serine phosphatase RsbU (regulator of sigma subunit)/pSer/pThr/pTyr-binding forkhead associated (FHA) protein
VPVLKVLKGGSPGQILELHGDRVVMGRHPNCHIVLENAAVSRSHAQIVEVQGAIYLEDLRSRNGTHLNGQRIRGRAELHDNDQIRVCDVLFSYHTAAPPTGLVEIPDDDTTSNGNGSGDSSAIRMAPGAAGTQVAIDSDRYMPSDGVTEDDASSIISTLDVGSGRHPRLAVKPETKLQAVLEISTNLGKTLELERVLPKILESLFKIFPQADRGFIVLKDQQTGKLLIKALRMRREEDNSPTRLSSTIVKQAMQTGRAILSADAGDDRRFRESESVSDLSIRSLMCAPLMSQDGTALGVIHLDTQDIRMQFMQDDLDVLTAVATHAAVALENAHLHSAAMKQRDLERELEFATQVQLGFLPAEQPRIDGYQFFDFYEAAHRIGGDFFDYVALPDGRLAITCGDVAGKGVPAALLMARLYSSTRYQLLAEPTAARALMGLNQVIVSAALGHRFVTCILAVLDPNKHELTLVNAGHLCPMIRDAEGSIQKLGQEESGLPLGVDPRQQYRQLTLTIRPGDTLLMFTDGVTEAMNPASELYGIQRLTQFFKDGPQDIEELGDALVDDVERFAEGRPQSDDICLIGFRRIPEAS